MLLKKIGFVFACCCSLTVSAQSYVELSNKAVDYIQKDSFAQAERLLIEALKLEPQNVHNVLLFSNLGLVQREMGSNDKAIESYSYALNLSPFAIPILLDRASLYMTIGKSDHAYLDYCQVLDKDKKNEEALLMRAYIYVTRRDYLAARIDYSTLLTTNPLHYNGRLGLVTLLQKEGKFKEAIDGINLMINSNLNDAPLYVVRADIEKDMGHADLALIDLDEAIKLDKDLVDAYLLRGTVYLNQNKKVLAKSDFEKALKLGVSATELYQQLEKCK